MFWANLIGFIIYARGSVIHLLLGILGGGKRARPIRSSITKDEKLRMSIHQLDLLLGKIPNATEQLMATIVEKVKTYTTKVKSTQDADLLQKPIAAMPSSTLDEFKKLLDEKKVNDQSFTRLLARYFIPEAHTMSEMIETLTILIEVLEKTFMIQMRQRIVDGAGRRLLHVQEP